MIRLDGVFGCPDKPSGKRKRNNETTRIFNDDKNYYTGLFLRNFGRHGATVSAVFLGGGSADNTDRCFVNGNYVYFGYRVSNGEYVLKLEPVWAGSDFIFDSVWRAWDYYVYDNGVVGIAAQNYPKGTDVDSGIL